MPLIHLTREMSPYGRKHNYDKIITSFINASYRDAQIICGVEYEIEHTILFLGSLIIHSFIFSTMSKHVEPGNKAAVYSEGFISALIPFRSKITSVFLNEL